MVIAEPELGDRVMRALILRRVALIETGAGDPVLIAREDAPDVVRLQGFLARNAYPYQAGETLSRRRRSTRQRGLTRAFNGRRAVSSKRVPCTGKAD
jgi:hypothetical protein